MDTLVIGHDEVGVIALSDGMKYYLTDCCGASAKGGEDSIVCRACYHDVDPQMGAALRLSTDPEPAEDIAWLLTTTTLVEVYGDGLPYDQWKAQSHLA